MSAGIRSGVNWMRWNLQVKNLRDRSDQQRLGQARRAGDQAMPARKQRDEDLLEVGERPGEGEEFPGETGRFGALSLRVWSPLFEAEQGSW